MQVENLAREIVARRRAAQAIQVPEPEPEFEPVRGIELAEAEHGRSMVGEHRKVWILMAIRKRYDTGWLPSSVTEHIVDYRYDRQAQEVVLTLDTGAVIRDGMTRITLEGRVDEIGVDELVAAVRRRGWTSVDLTGGLDFQRQAALRLAMLEPPVTVIRSQLTPGDLAEIAARVRTAAAAEQAAEPFGIRA